VRWTAPGPGDHLAAASRALAAGDSARAQRLARLALDLATADDLRVRAQATTLLGNAVLSSGSIETALSRYRAAADLYEALQDHVNVGYLLGAIGRLYLLNQDPAAAVVALASATARLRADGVIMLDLARAFANSGETYAAIAVLGSALTADPDVGAEDVHLLRAELLADLGDPVGALRDLGQPSPYQSLSAAAARALSMARLGRFDDAEENIGRALVAGRDNGPVLLRAAQIRALRGDSQGAESLLREALEASDPRLSQYELLQADSLKESCGV
jgi:tetratricopeptide (TPR) repeat protein